jgi:UDP-galactopyranose mutase
MTEWVIVGAGLTGATLAERIARLRKERVLVIDSRAHVGGNTYDGRDDAGILVHKYGAHIFHTNSERVWAYVREFSDWRQYEHRVRAVVDGHAVPIPFNFNTIEAIFSPAEGGTLITKLSELCPDGRSIPVLKLLENEDKDLRWLARFAYDNVFRNYTVKQWGMLPEELSPSVTARVPIRASRDDRYFQDKYQAMPTDGYARMVESMLDDPLIEVALETEYDETRNERHGRLRTIFTGPIDAFFDHRFGPLPYRSLDFVAETLDVEWHQLVGSVNYPNDHAYTRINEFKHLTGQSAPRTTIVYEYPRSHVPGKTEPYYPVPRDETRVLYNKYRTLAGSHPEILFCGRLGDYRYYNMDQAIGAALTLFDRRIGA